MHLSFCAEKSTTATRCYEEVARFVKMGSSKTTQHRMRAKARRKKRAAALSSAAISDGGRARTLCEKGVAQLELGNVSAAVEILGRAVRTDETCGAASDALAGALLEGGEPEAAAAELSRGLSSCEPSYVRHMYLAQLCTSAMESVTHLERALSLGDNGEEVARMQCTLAEMLLAAAEDADEATAAALDQRAERAVGAAVACATDGTQASVEAQLSLANLRLSQGRVEEARTAMRSACKPLGAALQALSTAAAESGEEESAALAAESLPGVEVRIAMGKQLVECALYALAVGVLESVVWECDFNVEVWFLLGMAHLRNGRVGEARDALETIGEVRKAAEGCDGTLDDSFLQELAAEIEEAEKGGPEKASD